jgi:hypothetical protein
MIGTARALLLASLCALAACKQGAPNFCTSDVHCAAGFSCDPATGACRCDGDSSCDQTESCNAAGFCQPKLRCLSTADCASDSICDSPSGACISKQACTIDVQCQQGQVCMDDFSCAAGCRASGDCPLGTVCRDCPSGTPTDQCRTGKLCVPGQCDSQLSCPYGDFCLDDGQGGKVCAPDPQHRPFCEPCTGRLAGSPDLCPGGAANYCLIDTSKPLGQAFYCGVDCSVGGPATCPNGYQCRDVRIVTAQNCDPNQGLSACPGIAVSCDPAKNHARTDGQPGIINDDCEAAQPALVGAVCDPKTSKCAAQCTGTGEAGINYFCSCIRDEDCPQDVCVSSQRACSISGKPCIPGQVPDDCNGGVSTIRCVKASDPRLGDIGYCRIGQNCAPAEGFTCDRLRSGP